jgi:histidinol-phosphate aminotransferase
MMTSSDMMRLAQPDVAGLPLYATDSTACAVDLSDNTNLWGAPPAALRAVAAADAALSRYPSLYSAHLRDELLRYLGLERIPGIGAVTGCGSDDVIDSTMRAFGAPGDQVAFSAPTFTMIPVFARLNGLVPVALPLTADFDVDAERLVDTRAKITYLCTPNNPTATAYSRAAVEYVVANAHGIILLDEAYAEFAAESFVDLVGRSERLIVARTFSKAFGLAGLRVGFGVGSRGLTELVERARGPYKVNAMAERAALGALGTEPDGLPWVRERVTLAIANRERLVRALHQLGLIALPSAANFVLVPTSRAPELFRALRARGVLVRCFAGLPQDLEPLAASGGAALRIGVGPWEMMQSLLDALAEALPC